MTLLRRTGGTLILSSLCACAALGTVMADFDIEGTARLEEAGMASRAETVPLIQLKTPPRRASPFHDLGYEGQMLAAEMVIDTVALEAQFTNRSGAALQLRFDQATMSSTQQPQELALLSWGGVVKGALVVQPSKHALVKALPMTLQPGERAHVSLSPSYAGLYPSRRLFGIRFADKQAALLEDGVGNTLRLRIPFEQDGKRYSLVFDLTARQARVRTAYF